MENKAHALAAGAFVLGVAALLVALAVWLTRDSGVSRAYLIATREPVSGLQLQAPVRFRGVGIGKVAAIGFDPQTPGTVLVSIAVDDQAPITKSTYATLGFQGVTGLAFIQLDDSGESKEALVSADGQPPRIPIRSNLFGRLSEQGVQVLGQVEESTRRLNLLLASDNQQALLAAVDAMGQAARNVGQLSVTLDALLKAQLGPDRVNIPQFVGEARGALQALQGASTDASRAAQAVGQTAGELTRTAQRLNEKGGALDQLGEGSAALAQSAATLNAATLPRVNRATDEAARSARQLGRAASSLQDNPQSLFYGNGAAAPGPGEPGFAAPGRSP